MEKLSENALKVLSDRYLLKSSNWKIIETPAELFLRVAGTVAKAELLYGNKSDAAFYSKKFYMLMSGLLFLPNSPTLMNAGTRANQLSACFVLPVEDTMNSIFTTLKNTALIQQSGGGTGFNFSHLRPKGDFISDSGGMASGPVSFMKIYNAATENIKQGGKRRGANMAILNIDHPDIEEFISAKHEENVLNNFNISVGMTGKFMDALKKDMNWKLLHPVSGKPVKRIKAKLLWQQIIESAWKTGDPGLIFLDNLEAGNPTPLIGIIESTNPCGEVPLLSYEPCNLGSVNLSKMIINGAAKKAVDWKKIATTVKLAVRFLDNVIDVNNYVLPETREMALGNRKIGLGVMGWAEMLIRLEIPYDSKAAVSLAEKLAAFIYKNCAEASTQLAKERGVFKNWKKSIYYPHTPLRNATVMSIAPTGTISIIANTSSSIEPLFALAFKREHVLNGKTLVDTNPVFVEYLKKQKLYSEKTAGRVMETGSIASIEGLPLKTKKIFKTALEIDYSWHLLHQAAFQKYTDNGVSKTINMPENASMKDAENAFLKAFEMKLKGITIFRYGSKGKQVLSVNTTNDTAASSKNKSCEIC